MSKSCIGDHRSTMMADPHRALIDVFVRLSIPATPTNEAMMQALTTDGESPVIKAYTHSNISVMMPRIWCKGVYFNGYNNSHSIRAMIPVCKPLTARMCESPAAEKYCRVEGSILALYPHSKADKSPMFFSDKLQRCSVAMHCCCMCMACCRRECGALCCDSCQDPSARYCRYKIPLRIMNCA